MPTTGFTTINGVLHADQVPLPAIAAAVGTPAYVYCANTVRDRFRRLDDAFAGVPHHIHFAVKANSNLHMLSLLRALGAGVDIVSGGELFRALEAGFGGRDVVFSGVGKTVAEIEQALRAGVALINVESEAELVAIDHVAGGLGLTAPIAIRVNPEVTVETPHAYIKTGEKGQKFGIPRDDVARLIAMIATLPHVELRGLGMHLGSQISNADPLRDALPRLLAAIAHARAEGHPVTYMDVGGGLSVPYEPNETSADLDDYARLVRAAALETGLTLLLEPGRYLVAESGVLLTEVLYRKHAAGKDFVVTDAGMNDLIRPALYQAYHAIEVVRHTAGALTADVVGPICESGDFFAKARVLPDVQAGALLAIRTAGAYGFTMASNYNSRPRPVEVLVDGERFAVAGAREQFDDLVRLERAPLHWRTA
ncbi:diaminopimelate decarboxylase [Gemmatimonas sp.]|uniref:diaminopimelate decarboxylase n=1 Tax=Gemmatimonas sp. TaxID=1962908 RepID=UPI0022C666EC|nr:diaminopimelate decarboxylase [Gemmatimonas sp.]MCA2982403.1 diaminopimelate decarboxylase [Gemmatimonas sp.]MCA2990405.1 diaminopimelate decarboxylase [Gemmatimonas sp.]MCA2994128.1 diaminopimelate decarboxylase [Gemmatimonas sp.]MCZ8013129.1 diaminopimelate decarboxylase [Gemmatimonas sp.]MCZ8265403.1 diaminopimelate decarboxylase [Gemmatimonas sp.]